jgi:hypothetical protein
MDLPVETNVEVKRAFLLPHKTCLANLTSLGTVQNTYNRFPSRRATAISPSPPTPSLTHFSTQLRPGAHQQRPRPVYWKPTFNLLANIRSTYTGTEGMSAPPVATSAGRKSTASSACSSQTLVDPSAAFPPPTYQTALRSHPDVRRFATPRVSGMHNTDMMEQRNEREVVNNTTTQRDNRARAQVRDILLAVDSIS